MINNRLGCLSPTALLSAAITLIVVLAIMFFDGNGLFSAGSLNAQSSAPLGGVTSHTAIGADCARCHPAYWESDRLSDRCLACHTNIKVELADANALHGIFQANQTPLDCRACHPEHRGPAAPLTELALASFPHEKLGFALNIHLKKEDGAPLVCADCHVDNQYRPFDANTCKICHAQMDIAFMVAHDLGFGEDCLACHDGIESYGKNFDHNATAFALTGKHSDALCTSCHLNARAIADLQSTPQECTACHLQDDYHQGRFGMNCAACHSAEVWSPARFDHDLANFKLTGKHIDVECQQCHLDNLFTGTPADCASCHVQDDPHSGRFGADCGACHSPEGWKPADFDHNKSAFPLTGAHVLLNCEQCHLSGQFQGLSSTCASCHQDPEYHARMFPDQACDACHVTAAWRPAQYNGPHAFPMRHGDATLCSDCHQPTLTTWTCYICHEQGEMINKHTGEGIPNFESCLDCHATGKKDEHKEGDE